MKNILIVDDDTHLRAVLTKILETEGFHTAQAVSGKEAINLITQADFDIVLLDLIMPDMNGIEAFMEIRKIKPKTKAIMITGFATVENAVDAIKKGASDYISKPFRVNDLLTIIRRVLEEANFEHNIQKLDIENTLNSLSNSIRRTIIQMLHNVQGMRLMEITRALDIEDHTKIVFHLRILKEAGIISQEKDKKYWLTKEGEKTLGILKVFQNYFS